MAWIWKTEIESSSEVSKYYTVSVDEKGEFGCSCPAWTRRRLTCRHIREARVRCESELDAFAGSIGFAGFNAADGWILKSGTPDPGIEPPLDKRSKIRWIKWHRAITGLGLREAKEEWERRYAGRAIAKPVEAIAPEQPKAPVTDPTKMPWRDYVATLAPSARWRIA